MSIEMVACIAIEAISILEKMHQAIVAGRATSVTDAAKPFLNEARGASDSAKLRRLVAAYKSIHGDPFGE